MLGTDSSSDGISPATCYHELGKLTSQGFFLKIFSHALQRLWKAHRLTKAYYIAFWLFGTALLCLGPLLQFYSTAVLNSNNTSIYGSVYQNAIAAFPSLHQWISELGYGVFSICSAIVMLFSLHATTYRGIFIRAFITSAATLTTLDLISDVYTGKFTIAATLTNLSCNIAGGLIVAAALVLVIRATKAISTATDDHISTQNFLSIVTPPLAGAIIILVAYYIIGLFFKLVPANIEVVIQPDNRGYVRFTPSHDLESPICKAGCEKNSETLKKFGFLTGAGTIKEMATLKHAKGPLELLWVKSKDNSTYSVTISAISNCYGLDAKKIKPPSFKSFKENNVKKMSISMDDGGGHLALVAPHSHLDIPESEDISFYVSKVGEGKQELELTRLLSGKSDFDYWSTAPNYKFIISGALSQGDDLTGIIPKSRLFEITINEKKYTIYLNSNSLGSLDKEASCNYLDISNLGKPNSLPLKNLSGSAGIVVNIERQLTDDKVYFSKGSAVTVRGSQGWLSTEKVQASEAKNFVRHGTLGELHFTGNVKTFFLNGAAITTSELDWISITNANLIGRMDQEGNLFFSGIGQNIWRGKNRLTQTRWENIDTSTQAVLLSILGLSIAALFGFFVNSMRENKKTELF